MQPRVTAILVAHDGAEFLGPTLAALRSQTTQPDAVVCVDLGSRDSSLGMLADSFPSQVVTAAGRRGFGSGVSKGVHVAVAADSEDWIWLLRHDSAPHPRALASLLAAVEIAPSVAVAGPKVMRWDRPDTIAEYGETMTRFGASIALVENELDQGQHDLMSDLLGVAAAGMLVRHPVWHSLGGFDPALPSIDASLDFSVRARLAGHRVVGVPSARVLSAGGPELFGRKTISGAARSRIARSAQLHRRLAYAPAWLLPAHWISLLPLAVIRSAGHLIQKRPGAITGEFVAALRAAFTDRVASSRRNIRRTRTLDWAAIDPLRMPPAAAREHRAQQREISAAAVVLPERTRPAFLQGGVWAVLLAAAIGAIAFSPFIGAAALSGGALAPLTDEIGALWSHATYGWQGSGAADPFTAVLAVLGSLTFWSPSTAIVGLYLAALPLAALGGWWCAVRFSDRAWPPAIAAVLWALAPPFLSSLTGGHLAAVIAHVLLPWLVIATLAADRSWSASGAAALLFAAVAAAAPILVPVLTLGLIARILARPKSMHRLAGIVVPAAVLFMPLVADQVARGNWLGLFVEPAVPLARDETSALQLALGFPGGGWASGFVLAAFLAPLGALAVLALFLPGSLRAIPPLALALAGFLTAVAGTRLELVQVGSQQIGVWPGAALSLYWLGLVGAVVVALDSLGRMAVVPALLVAVAAAAVVGPLLAAPLSGASAVAASGGSQLPALVVAEAAERPTLGTAQLVPQRDGGIAVILHRGDGTRLDEWSTLAVTADLTEEERTLAVVVGNLVSRSAVETAEELDARGIGFVLLSDAPEGAGADTRERAVAALDGNGALTPIGDTSLGLLWRYTGLSAGVPPTPQFAFTGWIAGLQVSVFVLALLLAVPSSRRRGRATVARAGLPGHAVGEDHG